jgi:Mrp family chromosome partitioning ATPase/uncharacterized protein involved in exopolysaccharide biosynthesis
MNQARSDASHDELSLWAEGSEQPDQAAPHPAQKLLTALQGRWHWAISLALVLGAAGALAGYFSQATRYQSTGTLRVQPREKALLYATPDKGVPYRYDAWLQAQIKQITSTQVVQQAMTSDRWQQATQRLAQAPDLGGFLAGLEAEADSGYEVEVTFQAGAPPLAQAGTNAVLNAFVEVYRKQNSSEADRYLTLLKDRKQRLQTQLRELRQRKAHLAQNMAVDALAQQYRFQQEQVHGYERQLTEIDMRLASRTGSRPSVEQMSIAQLASIDQRMQELFRQKEELERDIDTRTQSLGYGSHHKSVQQLRGQLDQVKQRIRRYAEKIRAGDIEPTRQQDRDRLSTDQLQQRKAQLQQQKQQAQARMRDLGRRLQQIRQVEDDIERVEQRLEETRFAIDKRDVESRISQRVSVARQADAASPANGDTRRKLAVLGGVAGSGIGFGGVVLLGLLGRRIRHAAEAQAARPNTRMLGVLPTLPQRLTDPDQAELAALSVHHIRTLLQISPGESSRAYAVTSPAAGSGKTSLSVALGLSFAATHTRTLIIDCDLVGAGLTRRLNAHRYADLATWLRREGALDEATLQQAEARALECGESLETALLALEALDENTLQSLDQQRRQTPIGLMDAASGLALEQCLSPVEAHGLSVLPVGSSDGRGPEALSPRALHRVVSEARQQFDMILMDTGPILGSIEASMVAKESDGVIFIVSRGDQKSLALRSIDAMRSIDAPLAGIVFNHADEQDMQRSSYTAASVSHNGLSRSQRSAPRARRRPLVPRDQVQRYGPLGSAVVACGQSENGEENGQPISNGHNSA